MQQSHRHNQRRMSDYAENARHYDKNKTQPEIRASKNKAKEKCGEAVEKVTKVTINKHY